MIKINSKDLHSPTKEKIKLEKRPTLVKPGERLFKGGSGSSGFRKAVAGVDCGVEGNSRSKAVL
jgi:hypothetical protein